jgi:hypothetical protein
MTENEAKTKWCPMARGVDLTLRGANPPMAHKCIASDCMMFRKKDDGRVYCGLAGKP